MNSNTENNENSKTKAVAEKMKATDDQAHMQVQKIKDSKLGKLLPTEYDRVSTKQVALISLILNAVVGVFTYALCIALFSTNPMASFAKSAWGIVLGILYLLSFGHDLFVYLTDKGTMLLSFLGLRALSLLGTIVVTLFLSGVSATLMFKSFIILINILACVAYMYIFSIYISHIKTGGSVSGDHQEV
ncbi:hypothetical protein NEAUS04_0197 [Nematocida ausubeli]|uniref:Uncharacterized protein n=1 Tax=Nematocida ausubeli (strain ATCC PRA-371 / ERTm2) TaxID=1913371 RepID=H8ZAE7_NEMA1|nr:uncharacterized protein NESG_02424 [Nematocida ausubeli]EHY66928.1 hypothetical protein NERG_00568 [Nematocida ausubeli]KAI5132295.1 hypothetical protein NEAUS06_0084 [Nematocida ausubeli]KAI5133576.1 hypothetical protein NEAUS07_0470 [Nematocida ausubeli]KAI5147172.1 hypothetical protein NEAUS05_0494 [Nematocida ausubeli]KAI5160864.1 hypothetical protein NEAUS04_0197 [Nematocida ausubeli]